MWSLFDVFEWRDHNVAEERNHFDQFENAVDSSQRDALFVVHLVDVTIFTVHQIQTEPDYLAKNEKNG